jgi:putative acetyltransferase
VQLPGDYQAPCGALLLALGTRSVAGCVALRRITLTDFPDAFEIKRLYVRPDARGMGTGRALLDAALTHAQKQSAQVVLLETLAVMHEALALYRTVGFAQCAPYHADTDASVIPMRLALSR